MTNLKLTLPFETLYILYLLQKSGYQAYLVGGAVRDILINALEKAKTQKEPEHKQKILDFDFTTNAKPEEIQQIFNESYYHNEFGMVGIGYKRLLEQMQDDGFNLPQLNLSSKLTQEKKNSQPTLLDLSQATKIHESLEETIEQLEEEKNLESKDELKTPPPFEITTYRSEGVYQDYRHPAEVSWGDSVQEDLLRRDFTINAMAISVNQSFLSEIFSQSKTIDKAEFELKADQFQVVDEHDGLNDLKEGVIRTVGDPSERFREDALRMMRAVRFAAQLEMMIGSETYQALKDQAPLIEKISLERIRDEFLKMLSTTQPDRAVIILEKVGLLKYFLPELIETKGVEQGGHHTTDVWTHALAAVKHCPNLDPIVRLATLLHDIGKPKTYQEIKGEISFYNHEVIGSRIASKIAKRLRLSNKQQQKLFDLVRYHMFYYQPHQTDGAIRRMIKRVGLHNVDELLDLREADRLGSGAKKTSWRLEELKQRMLEQLHQPLDETDLAINGHDLMTEFSLKPGPIIGQVLSELLERVLAQPNLNTREKLLSEAKKILVDETQD